MQDRRFFVPPFSGARCELSGEELRHMEVLRLKVGDVVTLIDGSGDEIEAEITAFFKTQADLNVLSRTKSKRELPVEIRLFQAVCKGDKNDWIVQKAVEIGVAQVELFTSSNTVKGGVNLARLQKIADEAVKQCKRARRVTVCPPIGWRELTERLSGFDAVVFCNEYETARSIGSVDFAALTPKRMAVIVGSEGGFTPAEAEELKSRSISVSLGNRILRAETAGLFALSAIVSRIEPLNL